MADFCEPTDLDPGRPPALPALLPGQVVGGYELVRELARGGFGVVWEALDPDLGRPIALKLLLLQDLDGLARLHREASVAARVGHPGIVPIHEVGSALIAGERVHFVAMGLVRGPTLSEAWDDLDREQRLAVLHQVALAVGHAHAHGALHRDLKPANILLAENLRPVVTDFGLARMEDSSRLTESGDVMGTLPYMSPEAVRGRPVDARTDVWSLGVMLYELLTDRRPFEGVAGQQVEAILRHGPTPIRRLAPDVSPALARICERALTRDPAGRFADAGAFAAALGDWLEGRPARLPRRPRRPMLAALAVVLALLAAGLGVRAQQARRQQRARRAEAARLARERRWAQALAACGDDPRLQALADRCRAALARRAAGQAALARQQVDHREAAGWIQRVSAAVERAQASMYRADLRPRARLDPLERQLTAAAARAAELASAGLWSIVGRGWRLAGWPERAERALQAARALAPEDRWVDRELGRLYLERGLASVLLRPQPGAPSRDRWLTLAATHLRRASARWAGARPLALRLLTAHLAYAERRVEDLLSCCRAALTEHADEPGVEAFEVLLGIALPAAEGIECLDRALTRKPHDPLAAYVRGVRRAQLEQWRQAIGDFTRALATHPRLLHARVDRGSAYRATGDERAALADYETALQQLPDHVPALWNRAILLHDAGRLQDAIAAYDRLRKVDPRRHEVLRHRGDAKLGLGRVADAIADYDARLALDRDHPLTLLHRSKARLLAGQNAAALADVERSMALGLHLPASYFQRGLLHARRGRLDAAETDFERVLAADPEHDEVRYHRAALAVQREQYDRALTELAAQIARAPERTPALVLRARIWMHRQQHRRAIPDLTRALRLALAPAAELLVMRGTSRRLSGDVTGGLADLQTALRRDPTPWTSWVELATALAQAGRPAESSKALDRARTLAPEPERPRVDAVRRRLRLGG